MTRDELKSLAEAWGGDLRRWPADRRAAAERLRDVDPEAVNRILDEATVLDRLLQSSAPPVPSIALRDRVIAAAPKPAAISRGAGRFWLNRLMLASGAGWAAAACAGVVAGMSLTTSMTADIQADAVLYQASLTGVDDTEVLG